MGKPKDEPVWVCLKWILMLSLSPIAFLLCMLMASYSLLRFLCKAALLFIIVLLNTPFLLMYNLSVLVFQYNLTRFQKHYNPEHYENLKPNHWNYSDPRASLGIEVKLLVSNFLKVVGGDLLLAVTTGIIAYYTAPIGAFYVTLIVGVIVVFHHWLNSDCVSKTVLSCLCDGYGLSPLMFLFSFVGLFDIGCHPVAKCSFAASLAFLFVKKEEENRDQPDKVDSDRDYVDEEVGRVGPVYERNANDQVFFSEEGPDESNVERDHTNLDEKDSPKGVPVAHPNYHRLFERTEEEPVEVTILEEGDTKPDEKESPKGVPVAHPNYHRLFERTEEEPIEVTILEEGDTKPDEKESPEGVPVAHSKYHRLFEETYRTEKLDDTTPDGKESPKVVLESSEPRPMLFEINTKPDQIGIVIEKGYNAPNENDGQEPSNRPSEIGQIEVGAKPGDKGFVTEVSWHQFKEAEIDPKQPVYIEFLQWNAFERGLFQLNPRVNFTIKEHKGVYRCILDSFMVLKLLGVSLCEYPVERLELSEDYSKTKINELFNFLCVLSKNNGFVTDKMRGRYERSLTLSKIAEGVQESDGYKIVHPMDERFLVALC